MINFRFIWNESPRTSGGATNRKDLGIITGRGCSKPLHESGIARGRVGAYIRKLAGRGQKVCGGGGVSLKG